MEGAAEVEVVVMTVAAEVKAVMAEEVAAATAVAAAVEAATVAATAQPVVTANSVLRKMVPLAHAVQALPPQQREGP